MTRLQNAKNELIEALAALESAAFQATTSHREAKTVASLPQMVASADLSALVFEISIIEAKLTEVVAMIASLDPSTVDSSKANGGDTQ